MSKKKKQQWWNSLTPEEKRRRINNWERKRKRRATKGKDETWSNAAGTFHKVWTSPNSYSVTRVQAPDISDIII